MLVASLVWLNASMPYPGWWAMPPVASAVLLIAAGCSAWVNRALSMPAAVGIGLISYPLYLIHWPLIAVFHIRYGPAIPVPCLVAVLGITIVLSVLVYGLVERPIRTGWHRGTIPALCGALACLGVYGLAAAGGCVPVRNETPCVLRADQTQRFDLTTLLTNWRRFVTYWWSDPYTIRVGEGSKITVLYGDSMAFQHIPRLKALLERSDAPARQALVIGSGGMCPIPGVEQPSRQQMERRFWKAIDTESDIDRVVIMASWWLYVSHWSEVTIAGERLANPAGRRKAVEAMDGLIAELVHRGKQVTLVLSFPAHSNLAPDAFFWRGFRTITCVTPPPVTVDQLSFNNAGFVEFQKELAGVARRHGVTVVDPVESLCPGGMCIAEDESGPIRYDQVHLRASFVRDHFDLLDFTVAP